MTVRANSIEVTGNFHGEPGVVECRGWGTPRFRFHPPQPFQSGVRPVPRQPPHSKTSRQCGRFRGKALALLAIGSPQHLQAREFMPLMGLSLLAHLLAERFATQFLDDNLPVVKLARQTQVNARALHGEL